MATIVRTDIHRPSAIVPADYKFVAFSVWEWSYAYDAAATGVMIAEATRLRLHMDQTKGKWAEHQHGGSCMICGAHAIYLATYYHPASNEYICCGMDCAENMSMMEVNAFRRLKDAITGAQKTRKGWVKAKRAMEFYQLEHVWMIYEECNAPDASTIEGALRQAGLENDEVARLALRDMFEEAGLDPLRQPVPWGKEERIICDIVGKLVQYGSLSEKQRGFLAKLAQDIKDRPERDALQAERDAKRAEEKAKALDAPRGRASAIVEVLKTETKVYDGRGYGYGQPDSREVMTVKSITSGWVAWGTVPASCSGVEKGQRIDLTATFEPKADDPKFAFFKRPSGCIIEESPS